ncbi:MAG TPA: PAS domain S-box protein [Acidimicrobiales bacterium]|nr:PAS domain S-box protein [Acidimicrobiales bacterium]
MGQRDKHDAKVGDISVGAVPAGAILRSILDLTDDAVITCDEGFVSSFSENAERLFGRSPEDVVGCPLSALFAPHLSDEMDRVFASVTAGERIRHFETEIVRPDGLPVPVSLSLAPVTDGDGAIVGSVVVARDVTEQHLAQATLAEIDARLEESEALAHVGSWLWDLRTGAVQWSSEFHRIHGIDPLDFAGTFESYMDLIDEADRSGTRAAMYESVEASRPLDLEYRVVHPDKKVHLIHVHANPTLGSDGKAVGLRGIGQDVTDETGPSPRGEEDPAG